MLNFAPSVGLLIAWWSNPHLCPHLCPDGGRWGFSLIGALYIQTSLENESTCGADALVLRGLLNALVYLHMHSHHLGVANYLSNGRDWQLVTEVRRSSISHLRCHTILVL